VSVIVIEFITLDGIVSDPDGSGGTPAGGWAFRHGPGTVAGDKFRLGRTLDEGVLLLGRSTWQLFSRLWPGRDDPFSARMNAVPKLVASRALADTSAWANSRVIDGELLPTVKNEPRDVIITGSLSVVHALMAGDLTRVHAVMVMLPPAPTIDLQPRHPGRKLTRRQPVGQQRYVEHNAPVHADPDPAYPPRLKLCPITSPPRVRSVRSVLACWPAFTQAWDGAIRFLESTRAR
jgi:dihydrofolate reductase